MTKLPYRPEIDGLRAIAVVSVILYHAQITILGHQPFKGGFIGVDIFFVISGYLITSIILKELVTTGSFSFKRFYERRVRRILPALLFVMLVSFPFAWKYFLPSSFIDFSKSILYSIGFSSNFYFHFTGQEYGAESGLLKPFLHTWSLSVEEQYYILFPIIFLITFKYFRKYLIHILIFGFIISLGLAELISRYFPSVSFYFLHTRIWELLAGSILAYFEIILGYRSKNRILNLVLPSIGIFLIGHSILYFNDEIFHPSFYTLSPIIGVCLIIWFTNKDELITKILSTKLFVGIGLISYSLYLWHYPIFAFNRLIEFTENDIFNKILLGLIIIIISIISYYFVEKPFRNKKYKFKFLLSIVFISIIVLVILNFNIIYKEGYKNRSSELYQDIKIGKIYNQLQNLDGNSCYGHPQLCKFNTSSNKKVYIIGDSHMASLAPNLREKLVNNGYQFITSTKGGCVYFPGFNSVDVKTQKINKCNDSYFKKLKKILSEEKNSIIIIGGRLPVYLSNYNFSKNEGGIEGKKWENKYVSIEKHKKIQTSFKDEILALSKQNKIILLYPMPEMRKNIPKYLFAKSKLMNLKIRHKVQIDDYISISYEIYKKRTQSSFDLLDSIQDNNIYRVYPHKLFCKTVKINRCISHDENDIFYADDNHPSLKGAEIINDLIMKEIEKIAF